MQEFPFPSIHSAAALAENGALLLEQRQNKLQSVTSASAEERARHRLSTAEETGRPGWNTCIHLRSEMI
jgi:hypothetical protein